MALSEIVRSGRLKHLIMHSGIHTGQLIFHAGTSTVCVDVPLKIAVQRMGRTVRGLHPQLLSSERGLIHPLVSLGCQVRARCFGLSLIDNGQREFLTRSRLKRVQVVYPPATSFASSGLRS